MHTSIVLTSILTVLPITIAHPLKARDTKDFTITSLGATFPYPVPPYGLDSVDSHVSINLSYPDASSTDGAILNTTCRVDWPAGTNPGPSEWTACADGALQFRLSANGWTSTTNFRAEFWQNLTPEGTGLDATHYLAMNPSSPNDPSSVLFCYQMGKFNPLTCTLTGPYGQAPKTVTMSPSEESARPN